MLACNSTGTSLGDSQFGLEMINTLLPRLGWRRIPATRVSGPTPKQPGVSARSSTVSALGSRSPVGIRRCGIGWATSFPHSSDWEFRRPDSSNTALPVGLMSEDTARHASLQPPAHGATSRLLGTKLLFYAVADADQQRHCPDAQAGKRHRSRSVREAGCMSTPRSIR